MTRNAPILILVLLALPAVGYAQIRAGSVREGPRIQPPVRPLEVEQGSNPSVGEAYALIESIFLRVWDERVAGAPAGEIMPLGDGYVRHFANGAIYFRSPPGGYKDVLGAYGEPMEGGNGIPDECDFDAAGWPRQWGEFRCVPTEGAHYVSGAIGTRYAVLGGPLSWLGWPVSREFRSGGWFRRPDDYMYQQFEHGMIEWHPDTGVVVEKAY
jgi:hypothetical protein